MLAFSSNLNYHQTALPQAYIAAQLFHHLQKLNVNLQIPEKIIELGAGTGFLTQHILKYLNKYNKYNKNNKNNKDFQYIFNEPSQNMYEQFVKYYNNFNDFNNKVIYNADAAEDLIQKQQNLDKTWVCSSMAWQWFENPIAQIQHILAKQVKLLAIAIPIQPSFQTWYDLQIALGIQNFPQANFLNLSDILNIFKNDENNKKYNKLLDKYQIHGFIEKVAIQNTSKNKSNKIYAKDMLLHLKNIGAYENNKNNINNNLNNENINNAFLNKQNYKISDLKKLHACQTTFSTHYHVLYLYAYMRI